MQVSFVSEYQTTITCSNCGKINRIGDKKIHKCSCGMIADRDENSAKTHLKLGIMERRQREAEIRKKIEAENNKRPKNIVNKKTMKHKR